MEDNLSNDLRNGRRFLWGRRSERDRKKGIKNEKVELKDSHEDFYSLLDLLCAVLEQANIKGPSHSLGRTFPPPPSNPRCSSSSINSLG